MKFYRTLQISRSNKFLLSKLSKQIQNVLGLLHQKISNLVEMNKFMGSLMTFCLNLYDLLMEHF